MTFVLHMEHTYGPPRPATGTALLSYYVYDVRTSQVTHVCASKACYRDNFTFLYVYDVCTSQGTHLWPSTACYSDSFTSLYVDDVRTSQGAQTTACNGDSFTYITT
jgi:hypothetical protein